MQFLTLAALLQGEKLTSEKSINNIVLPRLSPTYVILSLNNHIWDWIFGFSLATGQTSSNDNNSPYYSLTHFSQLSTW